MLRNDILVAIDEGKLTQRLRPYSADGLWEDIVNQGKQIMAEAHHRQHQQQKEQNGNDDENNLVVIEVGAQSARQCLLAAQAKFHTHCVEPSPKSFKQMQREIYRELEVEAAAAAAAAAAAENVNTNNHDRGGENSEILTTSSGRFIHLYNAAAGSESGKTLDFFTTGGTGDHVGEFDMWNMKPGKMPDEFPPEKRGEVIKVPSIKMDDLILYNKVQPFELQIMNHPKLGKGNKKKAKAFFPPPPKIDQVFALKIDTQGFEPSVFSGLSESIEQHKIQYIMTEYWPKGMDLIGGQFSKDSTQQCKLSVEILNTLLDADYTLYAMPLVAHPKAYINDDMNKAMNDWKRRPLHSIEADCMYLRQEMEKLFPNDEYHMGYWTDILAVAPGVDFSKFITMSMNYSKMK